jgi:uncharacterized protein YbaP (TraB family)
VLADLERRAPRALGVCIWRRALACWLLLVVLVALGCQPRAEAASSAVVASPAASPAPQPTSPVFLWRSQVGPSQVHWLGSVHVARPDIYPLDPRIEAASAASDTLVLELELDSATQLKAAERMLELGKLPAGKRLQDVVQPETWQLLQEAERRHGLNLFGMRGFRPWVVALALTTQALEKAGFSADQGIDEHFRRAAEGRLRIAALETVDEQLSLFTELTPEASENLLRQTIAEIEQYGAQLDASFRLWQAGDAAQLDELLLAPMRSEYPALFDKLFSQRNQRMLERLEQLAAKPGRYFVVVGAGHLVGAGGIVDLLRARGIVAQQL